jgi:hypothetical protein
LFFVTGAGRTKYFFSESTHAHSIFVSLEAVRGVEEHEAHRRDLLGCFRERHEELADLVVAEAPRARPFGERLLEAEEGAPASSAAHVAGSC